MAGLSAANPIVAILGAAVIAGGCAAKDEITPVSAGDAKVNAAIAQARATLPDFWPRFDDHEPGATAFRIKAKLKTPHGGFEHIWVDVVSHSALAVRGTLANDPADLGDLKFGSEVVVDDAAISDWSYEKDGKLYGGYTMRALMDRQSPEMQKKVGAMLPATPLESNVH